ncbi:hypothetical protein HDK90DRAFT_230965 [Phyllosticta capitalensis]|uniref:Uncharacterized protein n=1 Tax=Phyllosticta capitalensis TaxID=121624 RepID=A0ABR1YUC6_9PEZI
MLLPRKDAAPQARRSSSATHAPNCSFNNRPLMHATCIGVCRKLVGILRRPSRLSLRLLLISSNLVDSAVPRPRFPLTLRQSGSTRPYPWLRGARIDFLTRSEDLLRTGHVPIRHAVVDMQLRPWILRRQSNPTRRGSSSEQLSEAVIASKHHLHDYNEKHWTRIDPDEQRERQPVNSAIAVPLFSDGPPDALGIISTRAVSIGPR